MTRSAGPVYNAYGLGWMYRGDMFSQAFVRSQLKRLDENNRLRVKNCEFLTEHLREIKGIDTPFVPEDCEPVFYNYVVRFIPEEVGLDIAPKLLRDKVHELVMLKERIGAFHMKSLFCLAVLLFPG